MSLGPRDRALLLKAAELSRKCAELKQGGPFGAIVATAEGEVVAEGWNRVTGTNDPTAHAEVVAIREACAKLGTFSLAGHVLYSSCEPCPMCLTSAMWARLDRVVYANDRNDAAAIGFDDEYFYREVSLPPQSRTFKCEHLPLAEAKAVFTLWTQMADKVTY